MPSNTSKWRRPTPDFLDYDPLTGVKKLFDYDEATHTAIVRSEQDVAPLLKRTTELANTGATDGGIKRDWWHYADLPPIVQIELKNKGINIYSKDPAMIKRMFAEINSNYSKFKVTHKRHA